MGSRDDRPQLVSLGDAAYTVSQVCRILQPGMTPRKVHYWVDTDLLAPPIIHGGPGVPMLLSFQQLLEIRTVQRLRDELRFSLPRVRDAFTWILANLFATDWRDFYFDRGVNGALVIRYADEQMTVPGGQGVLKQTISELNRDVKSTRDAWETRRLLITDHVVTDTHVLGGAPVITGTRVEASVLASFADDDRTIDTQTFRRLTRMFGHVSRGALVDALRFEGVNLLAA